MPTLCYLHAELYGETDMEAAKIDQLMDGQDDQRRKYLQLIYGGDFVSYHYDDVIMARWRLKSPASWLFTQPFIQTQIKESSKAPRHWLCAGNSPGTGEFPAQMASNAENVSIWWRHHDKRVFSW